MFSQGYIGVSKNPENRFEQHRNRSENPHLNYAIKKYGWENIIKQIVLVSHNDYCYEVESKLRPVREIGWNISEGGSKPPKCQPRGADYVSPLKGISREVPWLVGKPAWNAGKHGYWSDEQRAKFVNGVSKPHTEEHIRKRQESRKVTLKAKGKIKGVVINGQTYDCVNSASIALNIPKATIKWWLYGNRVPSEKYKHITEFRWI